MTELFINLSGLALAVLGLFVMGRIVSCALLTVKGDTVSADRVIFNTIFLLLLACSMFIAEAGTPKLELMTSLVLLSSSLDLHSPPVRTHLVVLLLLFLVLVTCPEILLLYLSAALSFGLSLYVAFIRVVKSGKIHFSYQDWLRLLLTLAAGVFVICGGPVCSICSAALAVQIVSIGIYENMAAVASSLKKEHINDQVEKADPELRYRILHRRLLELIEDEEFYLDDDFSLQSIAERLATNQSYASKVVNSYMGMTIPQFRNELRFKAALRQIDENPDIRVSELSARCGYGTGVTFEREFKKRMKLTPSEYIRGIRAARALGHSEVLSSLEEEER